jgi:hypothetical protein
MRGAEAKYLNEGANKGAGESEGKYLNVELRENI